MKISQVALQLYTLRDYCKTSADFAASMKKVRTIGYEAVQLSGLGPIPVSDINNILAGEGLVCCATHEPALQILEDPQAVVERLHSLNCKYTAYPHPAGIDFNSAESILNLVKALDAAAAVLRKAGQVLCYHNHATEFIRFDGTTLLDYIYKHTEILAELDTYWVQFGGGNPVAWCEKMTGRLPLLHLKDYGFGTNNQPFMAEVGSGNLDFPAIIQAAERSGCEWFIVEQDTCPGDPFVSIQKSFDYMQSLAES